MDRFVEKLTAISGKVANNRALQVIQHAFTMLMPITMLGAFIALFNGMGIESYQAFIESTGIKTALTTAYQWTIGMFAVYIAFLVAYAFAEETKCAKSSMAVGLISLANFLISTPMVVEKTEFAQNTQLPTSWLGASGMFSAIVIAFVTGYIFLLCHKYHVEIKLPEQVPPFIAAQFSSIIPAAFATLLFAGLSVFLANTSFGCLHQIIYTFLAMPLQAVSANVFGLWILLVVMYGLWFFGIHGGITCGSISSVLFTQLQMENQMAFQAGQSLPHMFVGDNLSFNAGSLPMLVAALIVCRSVTGKTMSRMSVVPAAFSVDEPAYFGMPMILNANFFIPWVLGAPTIAVFFTHILKLVGLLPYSTCAGAGAYTLPFFVSNMMNYGTAGLFWGCVQFVLLVLMYIPFVKAYDKQLLAQEAEQEAAQEAEQEAVLE